jgi:hypothetical protein
MDFDMNKVKLASSECGLLETRGVKSERIQTGSFK